MSQPTEECKAAGPPKKSTYKPKGKISKLGDLPIYEVGNGKKAIISLYDIFGWNEVSKNVFALADELAERGNFTIIMPDPYRGEPWPVGQFPPQSELQKQAFASWLKGVASDIVIRKDIYEKILPYLYKLDIKQIGCIGLCWGGKQVFFMGQDNHRFNAIASIHGAWIDEDKSNALKVPVFYGPANGDTPVNVVKTCLDKKEFADKCVYHAFDDQTHGFCASRGDWTNKETKKAVEMVLNTAVKFFN
eukprot:478848_1